MPSLGKSASVIWGDAFLILIGGALGLLLAYFLRLQILVTYSKGFIVIVFIMDSLYYAMRGSYFIESELFNTTTAISLMMFLVFAVLDAFLPSKWAANQDSSTRAGEQSETTQNENAEQRPEDNIENPDQSPAESPEQQTPKKAKSLSGFVSDVVNFRLFTMILSILAWLAFMMRGMAYGASLGFNHDIYPNYKTIINPIFQDFFHYFTLIYCLGMYIMNDSPPLWMYFVLTVPMAVLPFFSTFIAYYVANPTISMSNADGVFNCFLIGILLYISFRLFFINQTNLTGMCLKDKIINLAIITIGFFWMLFVLNINQMNSKTSYY